MESSLWADYIYLSGDKTFYFVLWNSDGAKFIVVFAILCKGFKEQPILEEYELIFLVAST